MINGAYAKWESNSVPKRTLLFPDGLMAAALLCLTAMGCSNSDDGAPSTTAGTVPGDEIRIGLEGPLTGAQSHVGTGMFNGALMAADDTAGLGFTLQPMTSQIAPVAAIAIIEAASEAGSFDEVSLAF